MVDGAQTKQTTGGGGGGGGRDGSGSELIDDGNVIFVTPATLEAMRGAVGLLGGGPSDDEHAGIHFKHGRHCWVPPAPRSY